MAENRNYSELGYDFASFINRLDAVLSKDKTGKDFMIDLVDNAIKDGIKNPLRSENKSNMTRLLKDEKLSKNRAKIIRDNFDRDKLASYFESIFDDEDFDNEDNVNDICEEFFPDNQDVTFQNLPEKLAKLFLEIIRNRISEKDTRKKGDDEFLYSLADEKDFENKIKETVSALCSIKSTEELEERQISVTYINRKIPDNFLLCDEIQHKVARFYVLINQCFIAEQKNGAGPGDFISKKVNRQYKKLKERTDDKVEIFNLMVRFFMDQGNLPDKYLNAAVCIAAYFVQLCEVFDVPSE